MRLRLGDEGGQSLIIIIGGVLLIFVLAALAIDVAMWYQKHHQAQVSADAAALAAADCLAGANASATATNICTTGSDTTRASNQATTAATSNSAPISGTVTYGTDTNGTITNVTVTTSTGAPTFFSHITGLGSPNITARAVATLKTQYVDCTTSGPGCLMFYAASSSCSGAPNDALTIVAGSSDSFGGGIFTNGSMDDGQGNGGSFSGPVTYGAGGSCATNSRFKGTFSDGKIQQTTDRGSATSPNWLIDYSQIFAACSGAGCTGGGGTPGYCTHSAPSFSAPDGTTPNGVYCAYGTGTPSEPSTWNGSINFPSRVSATVTLIGGSVTLNSNSTYSAYSNNLLAYVTGTQPASSYLSPFIGNGGHLTLTGDIFAPNGGAALLHGNVSFTGFIQALTIYDKGGAQHGAGPKWSGGPTISGGVASLSQ